MEKNTRNTLMLSRIDSYINNVDSKASIGLAFISILIGSFITCFLPIINKITLIELFSVYNDLLISILKIILLSSVLLFLLFCIRSIFYLFLIITPDTNIESYKKDVSETNSRFFFYTIASKSFDDFLKLDDNDEKVITNDLQSQIFISSKICNRKFINFDKALLSLKISVFLFICVILISIIYILIKP